MKATRQGITGIDTEIHYAWNPPRLIYKFSVSYMGQDIVLHALPSDGSSVLLIFASMVFQFYVFSILFKHKNDLCHEQ